MTFYTRHFAGRIFQSLDDDLWWEVKPWLQHFEGYLEKAAAKAENRLREVRKENRK